MAKSDKKQVRVYNKYFDGQQFWVALIKLLFPKSVLWIERDATEREFHKDIDVLKSVEERMSIPWDIHNLDLVPKVRGFAVGDRVEVYKDYGSNMCWKVGTVVDVRVDKKGWHNNIYAIELDNGVGGLYRHGMYLRMLESIVDTKGGSYLIVCRNKKLGIEYIVEMAYKRSNAVMSVSGWNGVDSDNEYYWIERKDRSGVK